MLRIWLNLFWKEWREHQWKLVALLAIGLALPTYGLVADPGNIQANSSLSLFGIALLAPIYIAAGISAGENRRRTLPFLQAQPVAQWQWACAKLAVGLIVVWLPLVALSVFVNFAGYFVSMRQGGDAMVTSVEYQATWILLVAPSILVWSAAAGVNRSDEIRAAALAVVAMVGFWCVLVGAYRAVYPLGEMSDWNRPWLVMATAPGGLLPPALRNMEEQPHGMWPFWLLTLPAIAVHGILVAWFVLRFGKVTTHVDRSPQQAAGSTAVALSRPLSSPGTAIGWLQLRELGLVAALCPLLTLGLAAILATTAHPYGEFGVRFGEMLYVVLVLMGLLFSTVLGAGTFLRDVEPGLNTFWRSRPVDPEQWFWVKYLGGILLWAVALGVPASVYFMLLLGRTQNIHPEQWLLSMVAPLIGLALYTSSAAAMCLVRQPVYACLLSSGVVLILLGMILSEIRDPEIGVAVACTLAIGITAISTMLAWLAIRHDWGWNSSN